jgi:hypothetical protein
MAAAALRADAVTALDEVRTSKRPPMSPLEALAVYRIANGEAVKFLGRWSLSAGLAQEAVL